MSRKTTTILALVLCGMPIVFGSAQSSREKFSALARLPSGAGMRMVGAGSTANVDIYVNEYSSDAEANQLAGILLEGGSDRLFDAVEKLKSKGRVSLVGRVGFYDLKFIRSKAIPEGRRIYAITDRPIGFLEAYHGGRSGDYKFGIVILDLKQQGGKKEKGVGSLIYAAKLKVLDGNRLEIENYGIDPVQLLAVRRL